MKEYDKQIDIPSESIINSDNNDLKNNNESPFFESFLKKIHHQILKLKWSNIIVLFVLHFLFIVALVHLVEHPLKIYTCVFSTILGIFSGLGMSVGGHRLWAHRSFKASFTLKIILVILQTMTMNGSAFSYARDHRTHHKHSDTDKDPKNPSRGLFYSHIGWWMLKKSDKVKEAGEKLDFSDLKEDKIAWYQHKFYIPLFIILGVIIPTIVPYYAWNENIFTSFYMCTVSRIVVVLHHLFTVNSIAHFFGHRPYDFRIWPRENRIIIYLSLGEGNHNYHHTFPYDYASSEKKFWEFFNPSTLFIDIFALFGMAYDRKKASRNVIEGTIKRKGVPSYFDPPRSLAFRIINGIIDWFLGFIINLWPIWIIYSLKYCFGKPLLTY